MADLCVASHFNTSASCEQPRKVAGVKARKIAEGERLRMIKSSG